MAAEFALVMAGAAAALQPAAASREGNGQQRAGRARRSSADPQRAQQGATAAAAAAPAALDSLSRLQQLADASPQVAQLRRLQALADGRFAPVAQLAGDPEEEELVQGKFATAQFQPQLQQAPRANNTGLPDQLKSGIESLSGLSMVHVRVHYNSSQPAQLNALAYAQGSEIHVAPGQEQHLPHEAWHVVQQAQGRVRPTMQMKDGVPVNDDPGLEREADVMGERALEGGHRVDEAHHSVSIPTETAQPIDGVATNRLEVKVANNDSAPLANGRGSAQRGGNEMQRIADQRPEAALQRQVQRWGDGSERVGRLRAWQGVADGRGVGGKRQDLNPGCAMGEKASQIWHHEAPTAGAGDGRGLAAQRVAHSGEESQGRGAAEGKGRLNFLSTAPDTLSAGLTTQRVEDLRVAVNASPSVARLTQLRDAVNGRPPGSPTSSSGVVQLVRDLTEADDPRLDAMYETLEHLDDVLSFSSSIPPRLPREFFPLFAKAGAELHQISDARAVENDETLDRLEQDFGCLAFMMNGAKERAAIDRHATEPGSFRPPSRLPSRPETKTSMAKKRAQGLNEHLAEATSHEENLAKLRSLRDATFYVMGFSAMGQGDTAFIVRTVNLLKGLGLDAVGVKAAQSAFDPGKSFSASQFLHREQMLKMIKPTDFVIEGPLSDPASLKDPTQHTQVDLLRQTYPELAKVPNLRLYEYGSLDYRGGQLTQLGPQGATTPAGKANVVNHADDPRHAFMGMGHGEIGAFYNSKGKSGPVDLRTVLMQYAPTNRTSQEIFQHIGTAPDIFIGYANQIANVRGWVGAVSAHAAKIGRSALIIGLYGQVKAIQPFQIDHGNAVFVNDRIPDQAKKTGGAQAVLAKGASKSTVIISDSVPAPVMNALQMVARPFTLATGNYSLSEAIENGHFPIYETLPFNLGVESAFVGQVSEALKKLQLTETPFGAAVLRLAGAAPETLAGPTKSAGLTATEAMGIVLDHPHDVKVLMAVIKANTDITPGLVARLARLIPEHH